MDCAICGLHVFRLVGLDGFFVFQRLAVYPNHRNCAAGGFDACADAFEPFDLAAHVHAKQVKPGGPKKSKGPLR